MERAAANAALSTMRKSIAYARCSTDRQEKSIPDQNKSIHDWAAKHNFEVLFTIDDEGLSGASAENRPGFQRMIELAKAPDREWDTIICYDNSRFGRMTPNEKGYYRHILEKAGVEVRFVVGFQGTGPYADMIETMQDSESRNFLVKLSQDVIRGCLSLAEEGWWVAGAPPYGYDVLHHDRAGKPVLHIRYLDDGRKELRTPEGTSIRTTGRRERLPKGECKIRLIPGLPERVAVVRRIFTMALTKGTRTIANILNEDRVPPPRSPVWSTLYPGRWTHSTINKILRNPAYVGATAYNKTTTAKFHSIVNKTAVPRPGRSSAPRRNNDPKDWVIKEGAHEAIVDRALFDRIAALRQDRRAQIPNRWLRSGRAKNSPYLLSRLMKCAHCERSMVGSTEGEKFFYICKGYLESGTKVCTRVLIAKEGIETAVINIIQQIIDDYIGPAGKDHVARLVTEYLGESAESDRVALARLKRTRTDTDVAIDRLLTLLSPENKDLANEKVRHLREERDSMNRKIMELEAKTSGVPDRGEMCALVHRYAGQLNAVMKGGQLEEQKEFIRAFIEKIELDPGQATGRVYVRPLPQVGIPSGNLSFEDSHDHRTSSQKIPSLIWDISFAFRRLSIILEIQDCRRHLA